MNAQIPYDTRGRELTDGPRFPGGFSEYVNIFSLVFCSGCFCILRAYPVASCLHSGPVWHALTEKGCDDIRESPLKSCISSLISHIYLYLVSHVYRLKEDQTWLLTRGLQRSLIRGDLYATWVFSPQQPQYSVNIIDRLEIICSSLIIAHTTMFFRVFQKEKTLFSRKLKVQPTKH